MMQILTEKISRTKLSLGHFLKGFFRPKNDAVHIIFKISAVSGPKMQLRK